MKKSRYTTDKTPERKVLSYEKKPIAKTGREILALCNQIAAAMNKIYKYQLGQELCQCGTDLVSAVYLALDDMGFSKQKEEDILAINRCILRLLVVVRVTRDVNQVAQNNFEAIICKIASLKTQTENWLSFIQKENEKQNQ